MAEAMLDAGLAALGESAHATAECLPGPDLHRQPPIAPPATSPAASKSCSSSIASNCNRTPPPRLYVEIAITEGRMGRYAEAAATLEQMLAEYPADKSIDTLRLLASYRAGPVAATSPRRPFRGHEAPGDRPRDPGQPGRGPEPRRASSTTPCDLRNLAAKEPNNPIYEVELADRLHVRPQRGSHQDLRKPPETLRRERRDGRSSRARHASRSSTSMGDYAKGEAELETLLRADPDDPGRTTTWATSTPSRARTWRRPRR